MSIKTKDSFKFTFSTAEKSSNLIAVSEMSGLYQCEGLDW